MREPGALDHWMRHELQVLHGGLVRRRKSLAALLDEAEPACETREGEPHRFDRRELETWASVLGPGERTALKLPAVIRFPVDAREEAYFDDALAVAALRRLEGWGDAYAVRDGKAWVPHSLAAELLRKYGTTLQRVVLP